MKQWSIKRDDLGWYVIRDERGYYVDSAGSVEQGKIFAEHQAKKRGIEIELVTDELATGREESDDNNARL